MVQSMHFRLLANFEIAKQHATEPAMMFMTVVNGPSSATSPSGRMHTRHTTCCLTVFIFFSGIPDANLHVSCVHTSIAACPCKDIRFQAFKGCLQDFSLGDFGRRSIGGQSKAACTQAGDSISCLFTLRTALVDHHDGAQTALYELGRRYAPDPEHALRHGLHQGPMFQPSPTKSASAFDGHVPAKT